MAGVDRKAERDKRHRRVRKKVFGTSEHPRLCVTKSLRHLYVQVIDDTNGRTLAAASTLDPGLREAANGCNITSAKLVGKLIADRAAEKGIDTVIFDRGGYAYHGVVSALAEACREGGLRF
jgi:large subunit ribosomal protein L18